MRVWITCFVLVIGRLWLSASTLADDRLLFDPPPIAGVDDAGSVQEEPKAGESRNSAMSDSARRLRSDGRVGPARFAAAGVRSAATKDSSEAVAPAPLPPGRLPHEPRTGAGDDGVPSRLSPIGGPAATDPKEPAPLPEGAGYSATEVPDPTTTEGASSSPFREEPAASAVEKRAPAAAEEPADSAAEEEPRSLVPYDRGYSVVDESAARERGLAGRCRGGPGCGPSHSSGCSSGRDGCCRCRPFRLFDAGWLRQFLFGCDLICTF